jgi:hypothetical protein
MTMFAAEVVKVFVIGEGYGEANRSCASCLRSCTVANILVNALALALGLSLLCSRCALTLASVDVLDWVVCFICEWRL